jgi:hypothetical protein
MKNTDNSIDATRGQPLAVRAQARIKELEALVVEMPQGARERSEIEGSIASAKSLLTGNLDKLPPTTAADLNRWLETTKYIGQS